MSAMKVPIACIAIDSYSYAFITRKNFTSATEAFKGGRGLLWGSLFAEIP